MLVCLLASSHSGSADASYVHSYIDIRRYSRLELMMDMVVVLGEIMVFGGRARGIRMASKISVSSCKLSCTIGTFTHWRLLLVFRVTSCPTISKS